jgi:hypothetical protein
VLTPSEFARRWQAEVVARSKLPDDLRLVTAPPGFDATGLAEGARRFLVEAGLPESCAPFVGFKDIGRGLPRISDVYSPGHWSVGDATRITHFRMIGGDGAGNPLCVDVRDGRVVLVDHEDHFRTTQFMNSSVEHLAECLLAYHATPATDRREALRRVDPPALEDGAFWFYETSADNRSATVETPPAKTWWRFW